MYKSMGLCYKATSQVSPKWRQFYQVLDGNIEIASSVLSTVMVMYGFSFC